jgi:hypothetical protein
MAAKKHWRVVGYDSTTKIFEKLIPLERLSQKQMGEALRILASRAAERRFSRGAQRAYAQRAWPRTLGL